MKLEARTFIAHEVQDGLVFADLVGLVEQLQLQRQLKDGWQARSRSEVLVCVSCEDRTAAHTLIESSHS